MALEQEKLFIIPSWIAKGALTKKMFEAVNPPIFMIKNKPLHKEKLEQMLPDHYVEKLKTIFPSIWEKESFLTAEEFKNVFYAVKEMREKEVIENAKASVRTLEFIYKKPLAVAQNNLSKTTPNSLNARKIQKFINEYHFLHSVFAKYAEIAEAGFNYEARFRQDRTNLTAVSLNGEKYSVYDNSVRIFYKGERTKTDKSFDFSAPQSGRDFTTVNTLLTHLMNIELSLNKNIPYAEAGSYSEFLFIADQILAGHAVIYYASQIEQKHNEIISHYMNNVNLSTLQARKLMDGEDSLYENAIQKIQTEWDTMKYSLILAIDTKHPVQLSIQEEVIDDTDLSNEEFYDEVLDKIVNIKKIALGREESKEI